MQAMWRELADPGRQASSPPRFVDIFAGCGGLSLGLKRSGWRGLFAIEKDRFAFETLKANFLAGAEGRAYDWPAWLHQRPWSVEALVEEHRPQLQALRGNVELLAGGPPCQGFSSAGRRRPDDPRNVMVERYLEMVSILEPPLLLLENVRGITQDFKAPNSLARHHRGNFAAEIIARLSTDYDVQSVVLRASDYGVPQTRPCFVLVGIRRGAGTANLPLLDHLGAVRDQILAKYGIPACTSAGDAISDLEVARNETIPCPDSPGFDAIGYHAPLTAFQRATAWCMDQACGRSHPNPVRGQAVRT